MKISKLHLKTPDEAETVFYQAFTHCDADVMAGLWADQGVVCVHPGSGAIIGYNAIIRSWASIFSNVQRTEMKYTSINRVVSKKLTVSLIAEELLSSEKIEAVVLATNVYQKFDSGWLMTGHHASLVQQHSRGQTLQ